MTTRSRAFLALLSTAAWAAAAAPPPLDLQPFASGLAFPAEIAHANDGRIFVVELAGTVRVIRSGTVLPTPFLDLSAGNGGPVLVGGEQGLLGIAFHPAYTANGRFYVYYTRARAGDPGGNEIVVQRFLRSAGNPDVADPASGSVVLVVPHPQFSNHDGGKLAFGPDGHLYIGVGDGGGGGDPFETGQSLAELRGKILRLDIDSAEPYAIPPTNPFAASTNPAVRKEIWAYGLRNPWRFSFDRATGDLFIGDVGQNAREEVDFEPAGSGGGRNYGWSVFEGTQCFDPPSGCSLAGHVPPIIDYGRDLGASVTGGFRYRGRALPALAGHYVYGDFSSGRIWAAAPDAGGTWIPTQVATLPGLATFGEDESGELYAANLFEGTVVRLTPSATTIPRLVNLSTRMQVRTGEDVLIGGFIVGGSTPKTIVVRARGPSLASFGLGPTLANPMLRMVRSSDQATIAVNDDWQSGSEAARMAASGFAPPEPLESALLLTLGPGAYTAIVEGAGGGTGLGIVELFELDHPEIPLANISTRGQVLGGNDVMIGGFIVQGSGAQSVVVRARGPSLASSGIGDTLADPVLQLVRSSDRVTIAANDNWRTAPNAAQVEASGFAPGDDTEAAILVALPPGAYTAIVTGAGGGTGVGIVEVFSVP